MTGRLCASSGHEALLVVAKAYPKKFQTGRKCNLCSQEGVRSNQSLIPLPLVLFVDNPTNRQRINCNAETGGSDANRLSQP